MEEKKYEILYASLKNDILSGKLAPHAKLPSKRILASRTGYSTVTVERAYGMLEDEGYLTSEERRGYFVAPLERVFAHPTPVSSEITHLPEPTDGKNAAPDFEVSVWFKTVRRVLAEYGDLLFQKAPSKGCPILRNAIADYLLRYRGMTANPAAIVIGSGAEQLYEMAVKLLGREKIYGIESPCYGQIPAVYDGLGVKTCSLAMGKDGIDDRALTEGVFDVLHVTPFHSYPSGVSTSAAKRMLYLKRIRERGGTVIEDDYDSEFFRPAHPVETLYSMDSSGSVVYLNTFSKSLSPSMRLGYMILPPALLPVYEERLGMFSCSVPVLDQYVLAEFLSSGSFERHLNRMRRRLNRR